MVVLQLGPASKKEVVKELACILPAFRVSYVNSKPSQKRRILRFQGAMLWVLILLMLCSSGETAFCRDLMDMLHPQSGTASTQTSCKATLRGRIACKVARSGLPWPRSKLQLSCVHTSVLEERPPKPLMPILLLA